MVEERIFIDDRGIIPEEIRNMSSEERRKRIRQLEAEACTEKKEILKNKQKETA